MLFMSVQNVRYLLKNVLSLFKNPKSDFGHFSFPQIYWADVKYPWLYGKQHWMIFTTCYSATELMVFCNIMRLGGGPLVLGPTVDTYVK